jgi:hypothetical protein
MSLDIPAKWPVIGASKWHPSAIDHNMLMDVNPIRIIDSGGRVED